MLKNCRVPPASVRQTNYHYEKIRVNHQQRNCSGDQKSCELVVHDKIKQHPSEQNLLPKVNNIYLEANVGKDKIPICALLDSGSNCSLLSQRFYTSNSKHLHLLCSNNKSATSFNEKRSSVIGSVETDISFVGTSLLVPFKVIDNINYDAILIYK